MIHDPTFQCVFSVFSVCFQPAHSAARPPSNKLLWSGNSQIHYRLRTPECARAIGLLLVRLPSCTSTALYELGPTGALEQKLTPVSQSAAIGLRERVLWHGTSGARVFYCTGRIMRSSLVDLTNYTKCSRILPHFRVPLVVHFRVPLVEHSCQGVTLRM
jgi:hypothetical protein